MDSDAERQQRVEAWAAIRASAVARLREQQRQEALKPARDPDAVDPLVAWTSNMPKAEPDDSYKTLRAAISALEATVQRLAVELERHRAEDTAWTRKAFEQFADEAGEVTAGVKNRLARRVEKHARRLETLERRLDGIAKPKAVA